MSEWEIGSQRLVIGRGVRQGRTLSLYYEAMMREATNDGVMVGGFMVKSGRFADDKQ